ncbi:Eco57I restriction-modification methylase domain-containing protein [Rothia nasimurium]|uniref:Eco57I restriction-modification methylase domain-containing protein n=1 Tax=Rothia nasimurium TaxID=85336 RepID=UPI0014301077|nr:DNA methyltransferase [Rothia nasimurium]
MEAKKPAVDIFVDKNSIFQARRYGYTDEHPIVVITNFRQLSIYDSSIPVDALRDQAETGLLFSCVYTEFESTFEVICNYLSRLKVGTERWNELVSAHKPVEYLPAGTQFLQHLQQWRLELGSSIVTRSPNIDESELNDIVQLIINRFLFIRMCEDRGIELEDELRTAAGNITVSIDNLFARMDRRYNTGLFEQSPHSQSPISLVDGVTLCNIINRLYAPTSPFSYAVLDADFLGRVYEQSLSEGLRIDRDANNVPRVSLQPKSEYQHRDVVTTPQPLVDAVVHKAIDELAGKITQPKILDFATGSGRFLVSAYRKLVDILIANRIANGQYGSLIRRSTNDYGLPFSDKKSIVTESLFGIDIDFNAVEVARFSLLVVLLEDETLDTLPVGGSILPNLHSNIIHGNSLVGPSLDHPDWLEEPIYAVDVEAIGFTEFDVVVGNPPYVSTEDMRKLNIVEFNILQNTYSSLSRQWDKYFAFVEFGISMLSPNGVIGVVIPNKWMTVVSASSFRELLATSVHINWLKNFTHHSVFEERQIYVCGLVASKNESPRIDYSEPSSLSDGVNSASMHQLQRATWLPSPVSKPWVLPANSEQENVLQAIFHQSIPLKEIMEARNGLQTSANDVFLIRNPTVNLDGTVTFNAKLRGSGSVRTWTIESDLLIPYLDDSKNVLSFRTIESDSYLIFPYVENSGRASGKSLISENDLQNNYPKTYEYLLSCKERLLNRDRGAKQQMRDGGAFYAYGRGQALGYATQRPKIFYSVNQRGDKYGLDNRGVAFQSGGTAGEVALFPRDTPYDIDFILGLLAQPEIELFLRKRGSPFRGGFFARGTDVISSVPVPELDFTADVDIEFHDKVVSIVRNIRNKTQSLASCPRRLLDIRRREIQHQERLLSELFRRKWGLVD